MLIGPSWINVSRRFSTGGRNAWSVIDGCGLRGERRPTWTSAADLEVCPYKNKRGLNRFFGLAVFDAGFNIGVRRMDERG